MTRRGLILPTIGMAITFSVLAVALHARRGDGARTGPTSHDGTLLWPTGPPPFSERVESVPRELILGYARQLEFDTSAAASDAQNLVYRRGDAVVVGPFAQIAPERGAGSLSDAQLARGRIIARVSVSDSYPPLGLARGVSYLWVDSLASGFRWVIVPTDPALPLRAAPLTRTRHPRDGGADSCAGRPAQAAWQAYPDPEGAGGVGPWVSCPCWGCCCRGQPCFEATIDPGDPAMRSPKEWPRPVPLRGQ